MKAFLRNLSLCALMMISAKEIFSQATFQSSFNAGGTQNASLSGKRSSAVQTSDLGYAAVSTGGPFTIGANDLQLVKINSTGTLQFSKTLGGVQQDYITYITQNSDQSYLVTGYTFSAGPNRKWWVAKLTSAGAFVWQKMAGTSLYTEAHYAQETNDGNYMIMGFDYNSATIPQCGYFIVKLDQNGNILFQKKIRLGSGNIFGFGGQQTHDHDYIMAGDDQVNDIYLAKVDSAAGPSLSALWVKKIGSSGTDKARYIRETSDHGFIITGWTNSFGAGGFDALLVKTDSAGNVQWSRSYGGTGDDYSYEVKQTPDGGYVFSGYSNSFTSGGQNNMYLVKTNSIGDTLWTRSIGGIDTLQGYSVSRTNDGGYMVTGTHAANIVGLVFVKTDSLGQSQVCSNHTTTIVTTGNITSTANASSSAVTNLVFAITLQQNNSTLTPFTLCANNVLSVSSTSTNILCNGQCNGTATATPSGGTSPYTYAWTPSGGTNANATGLCAGNYSCTVTDNSSLTSQTTVTITQPAILSSSVSSQNNVLCHSSCNGNATVSAGGGTSPYTYVWSPSGGTNANATGLCAGNYTCTITDNNGCTHAQNITITQPTALSASAVSTNAACGNMNGTATATASGGTGTLTYNWTPSGGTNANATGLGAGSYTITITDANGCTITATTTIISPGGPSSSIQSQNNISCHGGNNGNATINATGGNSPYTYLWSPSGGTNANATGLSVGTYTCVVTDNSGCTTMQVVTITQPSVVSANTIGTSAACGNNNGTALATASGGTGTLTYNWTPSGGTNANATGLAAGNYTVTVTDANGCTATSIYTVTNASGPSATLQSQNNISCNGGNNGTATVNATGGTAPYIYAWSPSGGTNATGTGLSVGNYTCTVTDNNGCTTTQTVIITQPTAINLTPSNTSATCGNNNGSASVVASGGTGPYTYAWAPSGGTTANETGLGVGTYTVVVTDNNGCTQSSTTIVSNSNGPTITIQSQTNILCNGGNNGDATVNVTGGNSPYTYLWSPSGGTTSTATGLAAGIYTVVVTDMNGCTQVQTVTITEPSAINANAVSTNSSCGNNNGTATVIASGGTGTLTYNWSPSGGTNANATGLSAGNYIVTITDASGCTQTTSTIVNNSNGPTVSIQSQTNILCNGNNTGSATVNVTGGNSPYTYAWSPSGGTNANATGLSAGTYTVTVTDNSGCSQVTTIIISQPLALNGIANAVNVNCGANDGTASVNVSGGTGPYTYSWSPSANTSSSISNLSPGNYSCTITDANGCTQLVSTTIINSGNGPVITLTNDTTISIGGNVTLNATGGTTYSWSPALGLSCTTCANPIASPTQTTIYCVTADNGSGCTSTSCMIITIDIQCGEIFVPNAFSPNADGQNDLLCVNGNCIQTLHFSIFDRWGEKVFETFDKKFCWDGMYKDKLLNTAVFVYMLEATLSTGDSISKKGNITLIR